MVQRTRADSPTKTCSLDDCDRALRAKGMCSMHYRRANPPKKNKAIECPTCGTVTMKRDSDRRFCSLLCRDVWRCDQPDDPMYRAGMRGRAQVKCMLPVDHPVRVLIREAHTQRSALRVAYENEDWAGVLAQMEIATVKVDGCWLWPRRVTASGYGEVRMGRRTVSTHRLVMRAVLNGELDPDLPVHHKCAETLCCNPAHLQPVTHRENVAEMLERQYYVRRLASLERALREVDPRNPALAPWLTSDRVA